MVFYLFQMKFFYVLLFWCVNVNNYFKKRLFRLIFQVKKLWKTTIIIISKYSFLSLFCCSYISRYYGIFFRISMICWICICLHMFTPYLAFFLNVFVAVISLFLLLYDVILSKGDTTNVINSMMTSLGLLVVFLILVHFFPPMNVICIFHQS